MAAAAHRGDLSVMAGAQRVKMEATKREALEAEKGEGKEEEEEERCKDVNRETAAPSSHDDDAAAKEGDLNAYELQRERNIARNRARMEAVVGESKRGLAAMKRASAASSSAASKKPRRRPRPPPATRAEDRRAMPTRASRRLLKQPGCSRSPSSDFKELDRINGTPPDCRAFVSSRSSRPVIPARFVRGVASASLGVAGDDAEALRRLNSFRTSYMSRAALFNRVMAVSNALKLEDFAAVLEEEGGRGGGGGGGGGEEEDDKRELAALAREKLALMERGDPAAVREFVQRSKEREYERRKREAAAAAEAEEEEAEEEEEGE